MTLRFKGLKEEGIRFRQGRRDRAELPDRGLNLDLGEKLERKKAIKKNNAWAGR